MKGIMEVIRNYRKMGHKEFMKKWGEGIMRITPQQQLKAQFNGYIGSLLGTVLAMGFFFYYDLWPVSIILFFNIIVQASQAIGVYQQLNTLKQLESGQLGFMDEKANDIIKEKMEEVKDNV